MQNFATSVGTEISMECVECLHLQGQDVSRYLDCLNLVVEAQLRSLQTSVTADQSMSLTS